MALVQNDFFLIWLVDLGGLRHQKREVAISQNALLVLGGVEIEGA